MVALSKQILHCVKLGVKRSPFASLARQFALRNVFSSVLDIGHRKGWEAAAGWLLSSEGSPLLKNPQLLSALIADVSVEIDVELLLREVRKALLFDRSGLFDRDEIKTFVCALIQQLIHNEYIYFTTEEEAEKISSIPTDLQRVSGRPDTIRNLYLRALYMPLHAIFGDSRDGLRYGEGLGAPLADLVGRYMREHDEEARIAGLIECITPVHNSSQIVADMYEENPFPRWVRMPVPSDGSYRGDLERCFRPDELSFLEREFDVLIAGCGTGRQAIHCAHGYGGRAKLLAIDISRASLAYATRMAHGPYRVDNVRFAQADILDLAKSGPLFDVVECVGVLHHMSSPIEGWRILVDRLQTDGVMYLSLYSELGRRGIVQLRDRVAQEGGDGSPDFIRRFRYKLMTTGLGPLGADYFPRYRDFFALSSCRDLLFHVREHRLTIPQLSTMLDELGLEFRGFREPEPLAGKFWSNFPSGRDAISLERWWAFEQKNPDTFGEGYMFWCRKKRRRETPPTRRSFS